MKARHVGSPSPVNDEQQHTNKAGSGSAASSSIHYDGSSMPDGKNLCPSALSILRISRRCFCVGNLALVLKTLLLLVLISTKLVAADVFAVTDTFLPATNETTAPAGQNASDVDGRSTLAALDAQNEVEPPVLSKPEAKVDAVVNNKKDFVDDIDQISRRILTLELQGIFAVMNSSEPPAMFDAHLRESIILSQNGLIQVMAKKLIAERLRMNPETAGTRMHRVTFKGTSMEPTCIAEDPTRCDPQAPYRTITGVCNNLERKMWGRSLTPLVRILPAKYDDGIWAIRKSVSGEELPLVRNISIRLAKHVSNPSFVLTMLQMTYGQFLAHDMSHALDQTDGQGHAFLCCVGGKAISLRAQHPACENIVIPPDDDFYPMFQVECINFVRSQITPKLSCAAGHQDQLNSITSFLDLSTMYGNNVNAAITGRELSGGRLRATFRNGRHMLRMAPNMQGCGEPPERPCFISAGDNKINTVPSLVALHLMWNREHERISSELLRAHPGWNDDTLFQETRRISIAAYQHIFLNEYASTIFGPDLLKKYNLELSKPGEYSCLYNASVNPSIANEFSGAAFRFGHSQVSDFFLLHDEFELVEDLVALHKTFMKPGNLIHDKATFTKFVRGLMLQPAQQLENFFSTSLTTQLFRSNDKPFGFDLISFNIQRGRDHGLPPYVEMVAACGMQKPKSFEDLTPLMGRVKAGALSQIYDDVADIDLYVGGVCENPMKDSLFGPTFACIIGDQLQRLRIGDRFFYDSGSAKDCNSTVGHPNPFTQRQLAEIKKASMAALLCDHGEGIGSVSQFPFRLRTSKNLKVDCKSVPRMDLSAFTDRSGVTDARAFTSDENLPPGQTQRPAPAQQQQQQQQSAFQDSFGGLQQDSTMRDARQPTQTQQQVNQQQSLNPFANAGNFGQQRLEGQNPFQRLPLPSPGQPPAGDGFERLDTPDRQKFRQEGGGSGQQTTNQFNRPVFRPTLFNTMNQQQQQTKEQDQQQSRPSSLTPLRPLEANDGQQQSQQMRQPIRPSMPENQRPERPNNDGMFRPMIDHLVQQATGPGNPADRPRRWPEPRFFRPEIYGILEGR